MPVDFGQVIVDERLAGGYLGSSVRLLAEIRRVASAVGLPEDLDPDSEEVIGACDAGTPASGGRHANRALAVHPDRRTRGPADHETCKTKDDVQDGAAAEGQGSPRCFR